MLLVSLVHGYKKCVTDEDLNKTMERRLNAQGIAPKGRQSGGREGII
jgi:hypothetical protein